MSHQNHSATRTIFEVTGASLKIPNAVVTQLNWNYSELQHLDSDIIRVIILDCETAAPENQSALKPGEGVIIELSVAKVDVDRNTGTLVRVVSVLNQLIDPGFTLSAETIAINGITQDMVSGRRFNSDLVSQFVSDSALVIAHNAAFDRPMVEQITKCFSHLPWACSCKGDIDWLKLGMNSSSLEFLLFKHGYYYEPHRATADVFALIQLLAVRRDALYQLLHNAFSPRFSVRSIGAPFGAKDQLKGLGFKPVYEKNTFLYWEYANISQTQADQVFSMLTNLYEATRENCIIEIESHSRYIAANF